MIGSKGGYDIFLGGTTNKTTWRDTFIHYMSEKDPKIKCFNPVVENWTAQCIELENFVKMHSKYHVYVLTPRMRGAYSIAEMIDSVHDKTKKVYIYIYDEDIDDDGNVIKWDLQMKNSLNVISNMIITHGGHVAKSLNELISMIAEDHKSTPVLRHL